MHVSFSVVKRSTMAPCEDKGKRHTLSGKFTRNRHSEHAGVENIQSQGTAQGCPFEMLDPHPAMARFCPPPESSRSGEEGREP